MLTAITKSLRAVKAREIGSILSLRAMLDSPNVRVRLTDVPEFYCPTARALAKRSNQSFPDSSNSWLRGRLPRGSGKRLQDLLDDRAESLVRRDQIVGDPRPYD